MIKQFRILGMAVTFLFLAGLPSMAQMTWDSLKGEKVTYAIKKLGVKAGEATLEFVGPVTHAGHRYVLIIFRAAGFNFLDEEKIYADPKTLLPVRIERNLNIFGSRERIVEYYSQTPPQVRIVKTAKKKTMEMLLKNEKIVDNIYCFIFRYRREGTFKQGEVLELNLPTQRVEMAVKGIQKIVASGKIYDSYFLRTDPDKYQVWFDSKEGKIPLRIDGTSSMGPTSMTMRQYKKN